MLVGHKLSFNTETIQLTIQKLNSKTMNTITEKVIVEPTKENVQMVLDKIQNFVTENGYQFKGELKLKGELTFKSGKQKKVLRNYLTRLNWKMTLSQANKFLHALKRHNTSFDTRIGLSIRELAIIQARKDWKAARDRQELLLKSYKDLKIGFYK